MGEEAGGIKVEDEVMTDISNEFEKQKLAALRSLVERQHDPTSEGTDKEGRPIGVVFGAKHFPKKGGLDEFNRCVVYFLDKLCSKMQRGQDRFFVIADLQGWGYSNCDIRGYIGALSILQDCYPERLGKLLLVNVPYIFMAAWKLVYPFIDNNTRTKISFVEKSKLISILLEDIDESQLPENYGGKLTLVAMEDS